MKSQSFRARMGFAIAGIGIVFRREKSFRTQCLLSLVAVAVTAALRPGWLWAALIALAIGFLLALEMINAALEYLIDRVHPEIHDEIKFAKDAAAGGVLLAALFGAFVGAAMVVSQLV